MIRLTATLKSLLKKIKKHEAQKRPLTPMPRLLMHWWTPLILAIILLAISCFIASVWHSPLSKETLSTINILKPSTWPFVYHWPSAEAMKLCITISGAGLAFATWQQKHHDNAYNNDQAIVAAEREDHWKRREHILQTLDSNNPRIRLAAVSLLAELADSATHRRQLSASEIQQLQRHIIDTLCLQMQHEGLNLANEGTLEEHAEIQRAIFQVFLERIQNPKAEQSRANWSYQYINIKQCNILTQVTISQIQTNAILDFSDSVFQEQVTINESHIGLLFWETAYFMKQLVTLGGNIRTIIKTDGLPQHADITQFFNTTFISEKRGLNLNLQTRQNDEAVPSLSFIQCDFRKTTCDCPITCQCRDGADTTDCSCKAEDECLCVNTCTRNKLLIQTKSTTTQSNNIIRELAIYTCEASDIHISLETNTPGIHIVNSRITNLFKITFEHNYTSLRSPAEQEASEVIARNCTFTRNQPSLEPVRIVVNTPSIINKPIGFLNNSIFDLSGTGATHKLNAIPLFSSYDSYHFAEVGDSNDRLARWDTGRSTTPISSHSDDSPFSAFACGEHVNADSIQFRIATIADYDSILEMFGQSKKIEKADTFGRPTPNEYVQHETLNTLIEADTLYLVTDSKGPLATFAFIPGSNSAYGSISNGWHSNSDYHTICYVTAVRGRGIAHAIFNYVANQANYVRCDTSENNIAMQHSLEAFGFKKCGIFPADDGSTRIAYDWIKELEPQD